MKLNLAGLIVGSVLALGACTNAIPDSGNGVGGNFKFETTEYFNQTIGDRVLFVVDQSTLSAQAIVILDAQADWMMKNRAYTALIEGHADERGTREYNLALGARRASAVEAYLVSKGVAGSRLSTVTYGRERPIEICSKESCWSRNRRAVTVVSAKNS